MGSKSAPTILERNRIGGAFAKASEVFAQQRFGKSGVQIATGTVLRRNTDSYRYCKSRHIRQAAKRKKVSISFDLNSYCIGIIP